MVNIGCTPSEGDLSRIIELEFLKSDRVEAVKGVVKLKSAEEGLPSTFEALVEQDREGELLTYKAEFSQNGTGKTLTVFLETPSLKGKAVLARTSDVTNSETFSKCSQRPDVESVKNMDSSVATGGQFY